MNQALQDLILQATQAESLYRSGVIQSLWSGYGSIVRYGLKGCARKSVIVKHVDLSVDGHHPRGWNTDISHQRKIRSYQVEIAWYRQWSQCCDDSCRVPACLAFAEFDDQIFMVLEDLDAGGFPERRVQVIDAELQACLSWLANFHVTFLGQQPEDLWPTGTYWHLQTRPDELEALSDVALKNAAGMIDEKLRGSPFQTFVHGDAKLANFCFSPDGRSVAAVDFQYVGGGCGIKDVAYFIGSCLNEDECRRQEARLLNFYFQSLRQALHAKGKDKDVDAVALEQDWRGLYPLAWTDFHRFLKGWSPGHWKIHGYSERLAREVVSQLNEKYEAKHALVSG